MEKTKYTFAMLLDDIQSVLEEKPDERSGELEITSREYQSKLVVMQLLVRLADEYGDKEYEDEDKLRNAIDVKVKGDEQLSGFLFFASQNPQFDYSWSYMRKRRAGYTEFLVDAISFLKNVLTDINILGGKSWVEKEIHMVINDVVDVVLTKETPCVKTTIRWENFYRMVAVKKDYRISIISKGNVVMAGSRKETADAEKLIDVVQEILTTKTISTE